MPERLRFAPDWAGSPAEVAPRARSVRFGDGYEQRAGDGINGALPRWSLRFSGRRKADADEIASFLEAHRAVTAFTFALPDRDWAVVDSGFGVGDGVRTQFPLQYPGAAKRRSDYRGEWPTYTKPRVNLVRSSESIVSPWSWAAEVKVNAGVAPDGSYTASLVRHNGGSAFRAIYQDAGEKSDGGPLTFSVWLRAAHEGAKFSIGIRNFTDSVWHALGETATLTTEWVRYTLSVSSTQYDKRLGAYVYVGDRTVINGDAFYVWGAQIERAAAATRYIPNPSTTAKKREDPEWLPRPGLSGEAFQRARGWTSRPAVYLKDWHGRRKLHEVERRNIAVRSEQLDNASWAKTRSTITANVSTAPDGVASGDKLVEDTTAGSSHYAYQTFTSVERRFYTFSGWFKPGERTWVRLQFNRKDGTTAFADFDLTNGAISATNKQNGFYAIEKRADGWCRCSVTADIMSGVSTSNIIIYMLQGEGVPAYTGDGASGLHVWGVQLEEAPSITASEPTPYIKTEGAIVTVRDYSLNAEGVVTLATPPAAEAELSFDGAGEDLRTAVARRWSVSPDGPDSYAVQAEVDEVAA